MIRYIVIESKEMFKTYNEHNHETMISFHETLESAKNTVQKRGGVIIKAIPITTEKQK